MYNTINLQFRSKNMSNKLFNEFEIKSLAENKYVKNVTAKSITYTDEFKRYFISENISGKFPREIFEECGFDIEVLGIKRIESSGKRWREMYRNGGASRLQDTRKLNSGRPSEKELSIEAKYEKLQAKVKLLQAENELLKKLDMIERRVYRKK